MPDREPCPVCGSKLGILPYDSEGQVDVKPAITAGLRTVMEEQARATYDDALQLIEHFLDQPLEALKQELLERRERPIEWAAPIKPTE